MKSISIENEKSIYSMSGVDGVLQYIFNEIGYTNKIAVEIGVSGNNNTNTELLSHSGFNLLWLDCMSKPHIPVNTILHVECVTKTNVENIFKKYNIPQEFDLISIDIDGNDYHIREALSNYRPKVIVMEYNGNFSSTSEYIMGYDENYICVFPNIKFGASLQSLVNQANRLGYDYVYSESRGSDAFFIRKDINPFKPLTSEEGWVEFFGYKEECTDFYKNRNL
tara:strand:+ start:1199 stop:1867 length:669 start_codon:yes stop_codon:yes gene_type:complete